MRKVRGRIFPAAAVPDAAPAGAVRLSRISQWMTIRGCDAEQRGGVVAGLTTGAAGKSVSAHRWLGEFKPEDIHMTQLTLARRRVSLRAMVLATLCLICGSGIGALAEADEPTVIDYPDSGVALGQGWNSFAVAKTTATCLVFQKAESQPGQKKNMTMRAVSSRYQLDREIGVSASASYKGVVGSISGKASYSASVNIETNGTSVAALARVDNGNIYVGIPQAGVAEKIANMIADGKTPDEMNAAIGETAADVAKRSGNALPGLASDDIETRHRAFYIEKINAAAKANAAQGALIQLAPEFAKLANEDPAKFRKVCGDSYVATISQGGDLAMLFSFETRDIKKQQDIAASLKGSGWGVTAEGNMKSKIAEASKNTTTTLTYDQAGGSGDPIPTNLDELYDKIKAFPDAVAKAPYNYRLQLARYEDLINWPHEVDNEHASYQAIDALIYRASVWERLDTIVTEILNNTSDPFGIDGYLLGRGVSRQALLKRQGQVRRNHNEVMRIIKACLEKAGSAPPCDPSQEAAKLGQSIDALTAAEMEIRAMLPLPINPVVNPPERFAPAKTVRETLYKLWIQKVNAARCETKGSAVCLLNRDAEAYRAKIKVDPVPQFVILANVLDRACMKPDSKDYRLNLVNGCNFSDPRLLLRWDSAKRHLIQNATGKCANVRGGSTKEAADIILFKCQGPGKKYANDRWAMQKTSNGWYQFKNDKSKKCITVTGELRSGRRLTQSDCSKGRGKSIVWRLVMQ